MASSPQAPLEAPVIVYSTGWCGDCRRTKRFLDAHGIEYTLIDIDHNRDAASEVVRINGGFRTIPTVVFDDGSVLVEPSDRELAEKLGLAMR
jgi:mycoredoxin